MGSKENQSPPSRGKHRLPSDEEAAEGPKRRKHHHRRRCHPHHRRSSRDRDRQDDEEEVLPPAQSLSAVGRGDDDDREEGEILEDDDRDFVSHVDPQSGVLALNDGENGVKIFSEEVEKENSYRNIDEDDSRRDRSGSSVSEDGSQPKKSRRRSEDEFLDAKLEKHKLNRCSDSGYTGRKDSSKDNASRSSEKSGNQYKREDDRLRDRSSSRDSVRGRSKERDRRNRSYQENGCAHDRLDKYSERIREGDRRDLRVRERSSSYSRHYEQEDRHGSRGRDGERERDYKSSRDRDSVEEGKYARGERERSRSYNRHDVREDRHRTWDGDHERGRHDSMSKDGERRRYASREKYRGQERDIVRNIDGERRRDRDDNDRDRTQLRNWETRIDKDRERGWHNSQDRHRDSRHSRHNNLEHHRERTKSKELVKEAILTKNVVAVEENPAREEHEEDYQEKIEAQLAEQDEEDVEKIKEESRKRRQAILEKYKHKQLQQVADSGANNKENVEKVSIDKDKLQELTDNPALSQAPNVGLEKRHDASDVYDADPLFTLGKSPIQNGAPTLEKAADAGGLGEGTPKSERSADMFCDDIFGESPAGIRKLGKMDGPQIEKSGLHDNWDDAEGYYCYRFGEVLDGRYEVIAAHGKGVFSTVVRAKDLKASKGDPEEVAIKIIRNNETMYKAGLEELTILKKLAGADPDDRRHCVRFISHFKYRNHLCLVFESLHMNLREVLKKFGRNIGLKLTAVRAYAKQLLIALKHLRNCGVLHCDIKPDNMLVNEAKNVLKLCDFGNAMFSGKNEITPYLVSRFYRAPEIILGLPYDHPMDIWSVGCCLYELYSGKVLFPGPSNNDMLRLQMELKGPFPKKMLRKGAFTDQHFDQDLNFHATEEDPVTKKDVKRLLLNIKPKDFGKLISGSPGEDPKMLANFKDLLERIFVLDPEKRMTVSQALNHPFITGK